MHDKYYAVLDTNVLVSALLGASHMSNPTKVLKAVTDDRIIPILMDFPNDSERSWIVGHHFDSTVWYMDIYCAHRGVTPLAARPPLERD